MLFFLFYRSSDYLKNNFLEFRFSVLTLNSFAKLNPMQKIFKNAEHLSYELTLYDNLSIDEINYEEFKKYGFDRLSVLRKIENKVYCQDPKLTKSEDILQHFCLKLICVQSRWSLKWFITHETSLFKHRLNENHSKAKSFFLEKIWPHLSVVENVDSKTEFDPSINNNKRFTEDVLFHFTTCSEILSKRTQKISYGYFEPTTDVITTFLTELFRKKLESTMNILYDRVILDSDERLLKLNQIIFTSPQTTSNSISGNISDMMNSFPPCITGILKNLNSNHHLKYTDRQVLCLFLKDIGFSINDTISFFRTRFNCTPDQFNKEYLYSIRHNYGLEGKRANYSCFPCTRIIGLSNDNSCFGCPFVNNKDFVRTLGDIEDLGPDAIKSCSRFCSKLAGKEIEKIHHSPSEFFKNVSSDLNQKA